jgi:hypothetical protein
MVEASLAGIIDEMVPVSKQSCDQTAVIQDLDDRDRPVLFGPDANTSAHGISPLVIERCSISVQLSSQLPRGTLGSKVEEPSPARTKLNGSQGERSVGVC